MIPIADELQGKIVIVTGGNKGIGGGCSEAFVRCGAKVMAAGRDMKAGETLAKKLTHKGPGSCDFISCDVSDHEQVSDLVSSTVKKHGRLDCIVNNAGYLPNRKPLEEIPIEAFEAVLRTNLLGVFSGCKYALPHLRKTRGTIINIGSILGVTGQEESTLYTATKGAIAAFTKSLAMDESKNGVRVNVILPGNIRSDLGKGNDNPYATGPEDAETRSRMMQWLRRAGEPIEIGWVAAFLATSMASYITGAEIPVTGGFELGNGIRLHREETAKITAELFDTPTEQ